MKSQEVERRVLQKKNQILEEKQAKLEGELQAAAGSQTDVERLSKIVYQQAQTISEYEALNHELREDNLKLKMQLQTAAVESKALESQISSYVNLQVLYDELKSDHAKLLKRVQED